MFAEVEQQQGLSSNVALFVPQAVLEVGEVLELYDTVFDAHGRLDRLSKSASTQKRLAAGGNALMDDHVRFEFAEP